jgi:hypothetical protein
MVRIGSFVLLSLALNACAEYNSSEEAVIEVDPIERQKFYLAQERAQLDAYIITHELEYMVKERQQNLEIKSSTVQRFIYSMIVA